MSAKDEAVRRQAEKAKEKLAEAKAKYDEKPTDANGRRLEKARAEAREALAAKHAAFPQEKPPTQVLM